MNDLILIQEYFKGNERSLNTLLEGHLQKIFSACYRVCLNEDDANDVMQHVLLKIIRYLPKFEQKSNFSTWYYRIAYNESIDYLKKKKATVEIEKIESQISSNEDISSHTHARIIQEEVTTYINTLPLIERNIVLYYYYDDLKIREIATIMKMSESTVKTKLYRTKKLLTTKFTHYEKDY